MSFLAIELNIRKVPFHYPNLSKANTNGQFLAILLFHLKVGLFCKKKCNKFHHQLIR